MKKAVANIWLSIPKGVKTLLKIGLFILICFFILFIFPISKEIQPGYETLLTYTGSKDTIHAAKGCNNEGFKTSNWCQTDCWNGQDLVLPQVRNEPECSTYDKKRLLVYIYSHPHNYDFRQYVRTYVYFHFNESETAVVFLLGRSSDWTTKDEGKLRDEILTHRDMLELDMVESYANSTYKGLGFFHWLQKCGKNVELLAKADDIDSNVFSGLFVGYQMINRQYRLGNSYKDSVFCIGQMGNIDLQIPHRLYPKKLPHYCKGDMRTFMTRNVALEMLEAAKNAKVLKIDDAYITGFLRLRACVPIKMLAINLFYYPLFLTLRLLGLI